MVEEKKQIDEDKIVENSSEDEDIEDSKKDNSEKSEVVEKEKSRDNVEKGNDNVIFVGIKPFMNYVTGVVMQFQNKGQSGYASLVSQPVAHLVLKKTLTLTQQGW